MKLNDIVELEMLFTKCPFELFNSFSKKFWWFQSIFSRNCSFRIFTNKILGIIFVHTPNFDLESINNYISFNNSGLWIVWKKAGRPSVVEKAHFSPSDIAVRPIPLCQNLKKWADLSNILLIPNQSWNKLIIMNRENMVCNFKTT